MRRILKIVASLALVSTGAYPHLAGERLALRDGRATPRTVRPRTDLRYSPETRRIPSEARVRDADAAALERAEERLREASAAPSPQSEAVLRELLATPLPEGARADAIRNQAYRELARYYEDRASDLPAFALRDPGPDDACEGSIPVGIPHTETMTVAFPGDHNWRVLDVAGPEAWALRIETISDMPGTFTDDTDLTLWDACPSAGGTMIGFSEDKPDDFTSLIETDCLDPGAYYVEVGGFFDIATPDDFALEIEVIDTCTIPVPDDFEPVDTRENAPPIGFSNSLPEHARGWGRARSEIQGRTIFPYGDRDHARVELDREERVRISTAARHPTVFNRFDGSPAEENPDTRLKVFFEDGLNLGGRCNQPDLDFLPVCYSDADCPDSLDNPIPGLPPCIFTIFDPGPPPDPLEFELVGTDDRSAFDPAAELTMCLPRTGPDSPSLTIRQGYGPWVVRVEGQTDAERFDYELRVHNEEPCLFEQEPNNAFDDATPIEVGERIAGIYDFVVTNPLADADLFRFDVDEASWVKIETFSPDEFKSDTAFQLFVGPDDFGNYLPVAADDDSGQGFLSRTELLLPPADEYLGNRSADAAWFVNVTCNWYTNNFYYEVSVEAIRPPSVRVELRANP